MSSKAGATPEETVRMLDEAFNRGDVDGVVSFYEDGAVVTAGPTAIVRGAVEVRKFFEQVLQAGGKATELKTRVIEVDELALYLSRWTLEYRGSSGEELARQFSAISVMRRQATGEWKLVIDNAFGLMVLGAE